MDKIFIATVPASELDDDVYRFAFTSISERDRFAAALDGHADADGHPLVETHDESLSPSADRAIAELKVLMRWSELPNIG